MGDMKKEMMQELMGKGPASLSKVFGINEGDGTKEPAEQMIPADKIHPSDKNPFRVEMNGEMIELIASIKERGILVPLILRPHPGVAGEYEIIAGHRRYFAGSHLNLKEYPATTRNLTDEEADIIMVDSNLNRENISISEKAFAYRLKYEAIKRTSGRKCCGEEMGRRNSPIKKSSGIIAEQMGVSDRTIKDYVRLTYLSRKMLDVVEQKELPIKAAVQLSYLPLKAQDFLHSIMEAENLKIDLDAAKMLKEQFAEVENERISMDDVYGFLKSAQMRKPLESKPKAAIKINKSARKRFFPQSYDDYQIQQVIEELLGAWAREHNPEFENGGSN